MAEEKILGYLAKNDEIVDSGGFAAQHGLDHDEVVNIIKSLHGFRYVDAQVPILLLSSSSSSPLSMYFATDSNVYVYMIQSSYGSKYVLFIEGRG